MSHAKNKVNWCLKKAEKEIEEGKKHKGLIKVKPDLEKSSKHISKAEHYIRASFLLKKDFSDIGASTIFYSIYHCFLAILSKFGYESRNQECTFALMYKLIEDEEIDIKKETVEKVFALDVSVNTEFTSVNIREEYQYGTELKLKEDLYNELIELAKEILDKTKLIIEK